MEEGEIFLKDRAMPKAEWQIPVPVFYGFIALPQWVIDVPIDQ